MKNKIDDQFMEHLSDLYLELRDFEPSQQRYTADEIFKEDEGVSLSEFIRAFYSATGISQNLTLINNEVFFEDFYELDFLYEQHQEIALPYGPAFLALLGDPIYVKQFNLHLHENAGIRLIVANLTEREDWLDLLSYDRCCMVRVQVVENENVGERALGMLVHDPFSHVRDSAREKLSKTHPSQFDHSNNFEISGCVCNPQAKENLMGDFFLSHGLDIPVPTQAFEEESSEFGQWHWATQPFPSPWQDYLLIESVEYLKGPIPDQYSLNHAGHGINSYSLNFRYALGDIAIFAQSGWGGAYESTGAADAWDELQQRLSSLLIRMPVDGLDSSYVRKYLIVYSNFRIENKVEFWRHDNGNWTQLEEVNSLDLVVDFLDSAYGLEKDRFYYHGLLDESDGD